MNQLSILSCVNSCKPTHMNSSKVLTPLPSSQSKHKIDITSLYDSKKKETIINRFNIVSLILAKGVETLTFEKRNQYIREINMMGSILNVLSQKYKGAFVYPTKRLIVKIGVGTMQNNGRSGLIVIGDKISSIT